MQLRFVRMIGPSPGATLRELGVSDRMRVMLLTKTERAALEAETVDTRILHFTGEEEPARSTVVFSLGSSLDMVRSVLEGLAQIPQQYMLLTLVCRGSWCSLCTLCWCGGQLLVMCRCFGRAVGGWKNLQSGATGHAHSFVSDWSGCFQAIDAMR